MSDLVKRLRLLAAWHKPAGEEPIEPAPNKYRAFVEAADRIEALESVVREFPDILDDVLLSYHEATRNEWRKRAHAIVDKARAILGEGE